MNRYQVPLEALEASAHVPVEDQVEVTDLVPPVPDLVEEDERRRLALLRAGGAAY